MADAAAHLCLVLLFNYSLINVTIVYYYYHYYYYY